MSLKFQKKNKSLKINKFHTLVAVNNFQLFKQRPETPLPPFPLSHLVSCAVSARKLKCAYEIIQIR